MSQWPGKHGRIRQEMRHGDEPGSSIKRGCRCSSSSCRASIKVRTRIQIDAPQEQVRQHEHGQEEAGSASDPALAIRVDAAAGHHAVQVRMVHQVLVPGVQDGYR